jgi:uncharacterized protein (DUF302 family)
MSGLVRVDSNFTASGTLANLQSALQAANMIVFATFDHADAAKKVGLELRPTAVLAFGNPTAGTKLMQSNQAAGIDLTLKILVWEDQSGKAKLSYNDPVWLAERHALGSSAAPVIAGMTKLLATVTQKAAKG